MNSNLQSQFMYLFERVGEPLYFGPRGANNVYFNVPLDSLPTNLQHAANEFRKSMGAGATAFTVGAPKQRPNLGNIGRQCPKSAIFSYFMPTHRQAAEELKKILMDQSSLEDFMSMSCTCRDNEMINPRLFIFAFASSCLRRKDMNGFRIPAFWEIAPDQFVSPDVIREAQKQAVIPEQDRSLITVDRNFTGNDTNPENLLAYWREDLGVNSHHWHWHLIYPTSSPRGERDRKGELFYWMHHDMLARYEAERLCNGLARTKRLDLSESIPEGYFPKLYNTNAGRIWGARQEGTRLQSVERMADTRAPFQAEMETMKARRDRILEAIDTGVAIGAGNERIQLTVEKGIDVLGDIVEASDLTPNRQFYGDFHNDGHILIACSHDPKFSHKENIGVMGDASTAMRDPVFYRWHKYIDSVFDKYKGTIKPYDAGELAWQGIAVTEIIAQTPNRREPNTLHTSWMQTDIDLSRGIDFGRTNMNNLGSVWARVTHLNHEDFAYRIVVQNSGPQRQGTVRIFMAPRFNEHKKRFTYQEQRLLFFAMDKFSTTLRPGNNEIIRNSSESSATIPWEQSFRELERATNEPTAAQSVCGCGWPQHMLLPRGNATGVVFDLYAIVTDATKDQVARKNRTTEGQRQGCKESISYCGLLDELYPDARAMGYPFDRHGRREGNTVVKDLDHFMAGVPNSRSTQVRIIHSDRTSVRPGGAPSGMASLTMSSRPSSTTSSPNTSRPSSPSTVQQGRRPGGARGPIDFGGQSDGRKPSSGGSGGPWWNQPNQPSFGGGPPFGGGTFGNGGGSGGGGGPWNWPNRRGSSGGSRSPSPQGWTTISHASAGAGSGWNG